jgi:glutamate synthase (NADPH/NADH) large chain
VPSNLEPGAEREPVSADQIQVYQKQFGVTFEERDIVTRTLAQGGQEAVGSMGDDTPMPVLSRQVRPLYDYFRQQFAQVTNPAIDPLREQIVMSLETVFGPEKNLFEEIEDHAKRWVLDSPILSDGKFLGLLECHQDEGATATIDLGYAHTGTLKQAVATICDQAADAVRNGARLLVLSDRALSARFVIRPPTPCAMVHGCWCSLTEH